LFQKLIVKLNIKSQQIEKRKLKKKKIPCSSKETKGYHHFPSTDVETAQSDANIQ